MEHLRKKYICKNQIKKGRSSVRELIKLFNNGTSIALMIDQRVSEGIKTNFLIKKHIQPQYQLNLSKNLIVE